jgi:hypothetical protein
MDPADGPIGPVRRDEHGGIRVSHDRRQPLGQVSRLDRIAELAGQLRQRGRIA